MVYLKGGLIRWPLMRGGSHKGSLSSCECDLSSEWSHIRMVSHLGGLSSGWSLIRVFSHKGGLSQGGLSSGQSLIWVVSH